MGIIVQLPSSGDNELNLPFFHLPLTTVDDNFVYSDHSRCVRGAARLAIPIRCVLGLHTAQVRSHVDPLQRLSVDDESSCQDFLMYSVNIVYPDLHSI